MYSEVQLALFYYRIKYKYIEQRNWDVTEVEELKELQKALSIQPEEARDTAIATAAECFIGAAEKDLGISGDK